MWCLSASTIPILMCLSVCTKVTEVEVELVANRKTEQINTFLSSKTFRKQRVEQKLLLSAFRKARNGLSHRTVLITVTTISLVHNLSLQKNT